MSKPARIIISNLQIHSDPVLLRDAVITAFPVDWDGNPLSLRGGVEYELREAMPRRQCKSTSTAYPNLRCGKDRGHVKEGDPQHTQGKLVWTKQPKPPLTERMTRTVNDVLGDLPKLGDWNLPTPTIPPHDTPDGEQELIDWWMDTASSEVELTVPKAIEYGSTDLIDIGLMLGRTMKRAISEEEAAELGVFFYLIGKIARWQSAIQRGERPSDDTLLDIGVYVRMAQRIRHSGGWPGVEGADDGRV